MFFMFIKWRVWFCWFDNKVNSISNFCDNFNNDKDEIGVKFFKNLRIIFIF